MNSLSKICFSFMAIAFLTQTTAYASKSSCDGVHKKARSIKVSTVESWLEKNGIIQSDLNTSADGGVVKLKLKGKVTYTVDGKISSIKNDLNLKINTNYKDLDVVFNGSSDTFDIISVSANKVTLSARSSDFTGTTIELTRYNTEGREILRAVIHDTNGLLDTVAEGAL